MSSRWIAAVALVVVVFCGPSVDRDLPPAYRDVTVPPGLLESKDARARGAVLFVKNCAICHGERGDGHGLRSQTLSGRPRDFTDPSWRERTSPRHVFHAIREGVSGTAMPSWRSLSEEQSWDLVAWVLSLSERSR
jgi:mono/diheme cytochrome c family protein